MRVTLFTKSDCHLCEEVKQELEALQTEIPHSLVEVDIESDPILHKHYLELVPVLRVGPYELKAPIDSTQLRVTMSAARNGLQDREAAPTATRERAIGLHKLLLFLAKHWLAIVNFIVLLYVGLPFSAPMLMKAGAQRQASWVYALYSPLCHQLAYRSWFIFGDQIAYPREIAGTSLTSFAEASGFDELDDWAAREFVGNPRMGYKAALCQRDVAIYAAILAGGLLFALLRKRLKPIPLGMWFLFGVVPIAIDGGTQLLSAIPLFDFGLRESTPLLRVLTGTLFGLMNVWLAYPYLEESMHELQLVVTSKLAGAGILP